MRALVIDDSAVVRKVLGRILRPLGFEWDGAADGRAGLDWLAAHPVPDLILVDWNMPVMTGINFVRAVRADPRYAAAKLMMVTTEAAVEQVAEALEAGADEYVMKPFTTDVILSKLELLGVETCRA